MFSFLKGIGSSVLGSGLGKVASSIVGSVGDIGKNLISAVVPNVL
jgi:hypothetical protein